MTNLQGALLVAQLTRLEELTERRAANARILDAELATIDGLVPIRRDANVTRQAYYLYFFRYDKESFGGMSRDDFGKAMRAEGIPCGGLTGQPVYQNPLFGANPLRNSSAVISGPNGPVDYSEVSCRVAEDVAERTGFVVMQYALLGTEEDTFDIARAARKIRDQAPTLVGAR